MMKFQVRSFATKLDREYDDEAEAMEVAETVGRDSGEQCELIHWAVHHNLPNALPELVYRSCALKVFDPVKGWTQVNIHG